MATYAPTIATWTGIDVADIARIEAEADAMHVAGMHDTRVDILTRAAFHGFGDTTGEDDFGYSVAWVDLLDIGTFGDLTREYAADMPTISEDDMGESLAAYLATWRDMSGCRYALTFWDANGSRSAIGYSSREDMMHAYREHEAAYLAWLDED